MAARKKIELPEAWDYPRLPPKIWDCVQGTPEWCELRAGIPTASEFDRIITPGGADSASRNGYMYECLAERLMGRPTRDHITMWMDRGKELEGKAVQFYEFTSGQDTVPIGFMTDPERRWGASPDRTVGEDGLAEIKVPKEAVHVGYLLHGAVERTYKPQCQGQLWVSGRKWVDLMSYSEVMPPVIIRIERDEAYIGALARAVMAFSEEMLGLELILRERGYQIKEKPEPEIAMPADYNNPEVWASIFKGMTQ